MQSGSSVTPQGSSVSTPTATAAAAAVDAHKVYGSGETAVCALDGITVRFPSGGFSAIMGPSGSGKSTLMHCMAGLDRLSGGQVFIGGTDLATLDDRGLTLLRRDRVGFIFQSFNLVPTLTAIENITLPMDLAGRKPDRDWLDSVISTLGIGSRLKHKPGELSGGQQQRVAVGRALASRPDIIFGDEPTGNLDTHAGAEVLHLLRDAVDRLDQTVVIVTHDPGAAGYADNVVFLVDGRVVDDMVKPTTASIIDRMRDLDSLAAGADPARPDPARPDRDRADRAGADRDRAGQAGAGQHRADQARAMNPER